MDSFPVCFLGKSFLHDLIISLAQVNMICLTQKCSIQLIILNQMSVLENRSEEYMNLLLLAPNQEIIFYIRILIYRFKIA